MSGRGTFHNSHNHHHNNNNSNNNNNNRRKNNAGYSKPDGPKREAILDLAKYQDQQVRVEFAGGRVVTGILKGYDQLMNLVLEEVKEYIRDPQDDTELTDRTRDLGLVVVRCTSLLSISPVSGSEYIDNPFV